MKRLLLALALVAAPALADTDLPQPRWANEQLPDPHQEAEAQALMGTLRCLVCQGQSIADSNADLAASMRAMVRTHIAAGEKPEDIRAWLIQRYGKWVSFAPGFTALTWPLWAAPIALMLVGLWLARNRFGRRG